MGSRKIVSFCCFGTIIIIGLINSGFLFCFSGTVIVYVSGSRTNVLTKSEIYPVNLNSTRNGIDKQKHNLVSDPYVAGNGGIISIDLLMTQITVSDALIEHNVCKGDNVSLLILIFSNPPNTERRNVIRETWLSDLAHSIRYTFVLAKSEDRRVKKQLEIENEENRDILLLNFMDSYKNLTYKTVSSFGWATKKCQKAEYLLKIDDDMWLNKKALTTILSRGVLKGALGGSCNHGAQPVRDPDSKYYVPKKIFPESYYPTFCSGTAYVADFNLIKNIVKISRTTPFFPLEDIYVAICVQKLKAKILNMYGFNSVHVKANPCWLKSDWLITTHEYLPYELRKVWRTKCNGLFPMNQGSLTYRPKPDISGSLQEKKRQLNKLRMQEIFRINAEKNRPPVRRQRYRKKVLVFN